MNLTVERTAPRRASLDFDERIWERLRDRVNTLYDQVKGGARAAGSAALTFAVSRDGDGIVQVKVTLKEGGKSEGVWSAAAGGQLTLEGL